MTTTSVFDARRRCLRSLPWLVLSLSVAAQLVGRRAAARAALRSAEAETAPWQQNEGLVAALGAPEPPALPLGQALLDVLAILRDGDASRGVKVESMALPGHAGSLVDGLPDAQSLARLARPWRGAPGLRALRLDVRASYRSYVGLKAWMADLDAQPLSFRRVWLEDQHLQLVLDIVGA